MDQPAPSPAVAALGCARAHSDLLPLLCFCVCAVLYAPALGFDFVYDDKLQLLGNPHVQAWSGLRAAFSEHVWAFDPAHAHASVRYYRPLFMAILTVAYALFGREALGYHALCVALHLGAGYALWRLSARLRLARPARLLALSVFLLHPVQIQSVAWISALSDPLCTLCLLSAAAAWLQYARERRARARVLALLWLFSACLVLERALVGVPILWLIGLYARGRPRAALRLLARDAAWLLLPVTAALGLRFAAIGGAIAASELSSDELLWSTPLVVARYAQNLAWPRELALGYPGALAAAPHWPALVPRLAALSLLAAAAALRSRSQGLRLLLLAAAALSFAPALSLGVLPAYALVQDRYLYLPLAFAALWLGDCVFPRAAPRSRAALWGGALASVWLCALIALHPANLAPYRDDLSVFSRAAVVDAGNPHWLLNTALAARERGEVDPQCRLLRQAHALSVSRAREAEPALIDYALGNCERDAQRLTQALAAYDRSVALSRGQLLEAGVNRITTLVELGRHAQALRAAQALIRTHPRASAAFKLYGLVAANLGDYATAQRSLARARALNPADATLPALLARVQAKH